MKAGRLAAAALMVAALACEGLEAFRHRAAKVWYVAWTLIGLALAAAMVVLPIKFGAGFNPATIPAAIGIALATLLPVALAWRGQVVMAGLALALTAAATFPVAFQGVAPSLDRIFLSRSVARIVGTVGSDGPVAAAGYSEPSLVFLLGTKTRFVDGAGAAQHLADNRRTLAVVSDRQLPAFFAEASVRGVEVEEFGRVDGFNYSRGKATTLVVLGVKNP